MEKYGWAVPDALALQCIARVGPIVEIGAGKGYWGGGSRPPAVCVDVRVRAEERRVAQAC
jgi:hypothetical protein